VKLHPATITKLPALENRRTEYRDELVPGLVLRVSLTGARTFLVSYSRRSSQVARRHY